MEFRTTTNMRASSTTPFSYQSSANPLQGGNKQYNHDLMRSSDNGIVKGGGVGGGRRMIIMSKAKNKSSYFSLEAIMLLGGLTASLLILPLILPPLPPPPPMLLLLPIFILAGLMVFAFMPSSSNASGNAAATYSYSSPSAT